MASGWLDSLKFPLASMMRRAYHWGDDRIPPVLRSMAGVLLIVGGTFGFLPVLGFWMIPMGGVLIALDIPPLRRRLRRWLDKWAGSTRS